MPVPPLSQERRLDLDKQAKQLGDECRVAIRNIRRDVIDKLRNYEKSSILGKDFSKTYQNDIQKVTESWIKTVDGVISQYSTSISVL